jgi:hypothetical protein
VSSTTCKTCLYEAVNGPLDYTKSNALLGSLVGSKEASVRRHRKHMNSPQTGAHGVSDTFLSEQGIPSEVVTSRGMSVRDPDTGSWQKVSWQPNAKALHDTLKYDDLYKALDGWAPVAYPIRGAATQRTAVLNMADLQIGKAMQRGGGTPETVARVRKSIEAFVAYLIGSGIKRAVLAENGDGIENCFNVPSQLVTNDLPVPEQIRVLRRLILEAIKAVAPLVDELIYVSIPSNHGAARVGYKSPGGTVDADFGLEVSYQIEDAVTENPHLGHVRFIRPESLDETAVLTVSNTKLAFNHGHQSQGPGGLSKWWAGQDHGRMAGWDADILITAHFHSLALEQSGDGRWIIKTSSSDASSDWFTNRTGESALQGMTAFDVLDGQWSNLRIL